MFESKCATNCIRKYDKAYKLYSNVEGTIFTSYMESTDIDPTKFYAQMNEMTPQQMSQAQMQQETGMSGINAAKEMYMGKGQAGSEKYFNQAKDGKGGM